MLRGIFSHSEIFYSTLLILKCVCLCVDKVCLSLDILLYLEIFFASCLWWNKLWWWVKIANSKCSLKLEHWVGIPSVTVCLFLFFFLVFYCDFFLVFLFLSIFFRFQEYSISYSVFCNLWIEEKMQKRCFLFVCFANGNKFFKEKKKLFFFVLIFSFVVFLCSFFVPIGTKNL